MTAATAKAPTLAWLLTALTCLLAGMAIVESRHQTVTLPAYGPTGLVGPVETVDSPTPSPAPPPSPIPLFDDVPVSPSAGSTTLHVARLTVSPGVRLAPEVAPGPTVLMVEAGSLSVRADGAVWVGQGLDAVQTDTLLRNGQRFVIAPAARYAVRNDGPTPAVALVVAIVPGSAPSEHRNDPER